MTTAATDRRSFLKTGALAATPLAIIAPAAALADDPSHARLARLEDERAIEGLTRAFVRRFNGKGSSDCAEFLARADAVRLHESLCAIAEDPVRDGTLEFADDGRSARLSLSCRVEIEQPFEGNSTIERMARFQGHGHHRHSEERVLLGEFTKTVRGWAISRLRLA